MGKITITQKKLLTHICALYYRPCCNSDQQPIVLPACSSFAAYLINSTLLILPVFVNSLTTYNSSLNDLIFATLFIVGIGLYNYGGEGVPQYTVIKPENKTIKKNGDEATSEFEDLNIRED